MLTTYINGRRGSIGNLSHLNQMRAFSFCLSIFRGNNNGHLYRDLFTLLGGTIVLPRRGTTDPIKTMGIFLTLMGHHTTAKTDTSYFPLQNGRLHFVLKGHKVNLSGPHYRFLGPTRRINKTITTLYGPNGTHFPFYHGLQKHGTIKRGDSGIVPILYKS